MLTTGEPAGIGPDLVVQLLQQPLPGSFCVVTDPTLLLERARAIGLDLEEVDGGVAGPGGGTPTKPVGTVVFARATRGQEDQPEGELKSFGEIGRAEVRRQATLCALELLLP